MLVVTTAGPALLPSGSLKKIKVIHYHSFSLPTTVNHVIYYVSRLQCLKKSFSKWFIIQVVIVNGLSSNIFISVLDLVVGQGKGE